MMNNFAWAAITHFRICGASQAYFGRFKGCYQRGYYCKECLYNQISLKVRDSEEKLVFSSRLPLRCHIARLGMFSVNSGILISLYRSAHHPHTTLATGEWMIFWPGEDSLVEVGPTSVAAILKFCHPTCKVDTSNLTMGSYNPNFFAANHGLAQAFNALKRNAINCSTASLHIQSTNIAQHAQDMWYQESPTLLGVLDHGLLVVCGRSVKYSFCLIRNYSLHEFHKLVGSNTHCHKT